VQMGLGPDCEKMIPRQLDRPAGVPKLSPPPNGPGNWNGRGDKSGQMLILRPAED
jgi:hypothetical protein